MEFGDSKRLLATLRCHLLHLSIGHNLNSPLTTICTFVSWSYNAVPITPAQSTETSIVSLWVIRNLVPQRIRSLNVQFVQTHIHFVLWVSGATP